ncbi:hypothetical protein [Leifsonia sp. NPDC077715]|uniref:hypothetical protein n=1 Tax=Leifsonia sp. NPDC077715 TaxID=3155539 RepID=UPI0034482E0C
MTDDDAALRDGLEPALRDAIARLSDASVTPDGRRLVGERLAAAAERAQERLGERAREPRIHRIVGAAASASMALALGDGMVPVSEVTERLRDGLDLLTAGSWSPEDQDPAE